MFLLPKYTDIGHDRTTHTQTAQIRMDAVSNQLSLAEGKKLEILTEADAIKSEIISQIYHGIVGRCLGIMKQLLSHFKRVEETKIINKLNRLYNGTLVLLESLDQSVNLSSYCLTDTKKEVLNLGLNCHVSTKFDKCVKSTEFEILYESLLRLENDKKIIVKREFRDQLLGDATRMRSGGRSTLLTPHLHEAAKNLWNNKDIIIRKSDECKTIVIMNREEYKDKLDQILPDTTTFDAIGRDPTKELKVEVNKIIKSINRDCGRRILELSIGEFASGYL